MLFFLRNSFFTCYIHAKLMLGQLQCNVDTNEVNSMKTAYKYTIKNSHEANIIYMTAVVEI
jgi:hypothetical protein